MTAPRGEGAQRVTLAGGRVVDPGSGVDRVADLHLADGLVAGLGDPPPGFRADVVHDMRGLVICPGLVELRASLREPGREHKATIASETRAAARGGVTTVCCTPDTLPPVDTPAVVELIHQRAQEAGHARVEVLGALTRGLEGTHLAEMGALRDAGCIGVCNGPRTIASTELMRRALEYAATFGLLVSLQPSDPWLTAQGAAHEGAVATRCGLPGIPATAETVTLARDLLLVEETGVRAHFSHLSTARGVEMIADARARGLPVSADATAHHLHLTEADLAEFDSAAHVLPPLRTARDREALRGGLQDGTLVAVSSGHQPHEPDAKQAPFPETEPGIVGLETLLPLMLRLVEEGILELAEAIQRVTLGPARVAALDAGTLRPGRPADVCVFDPARRWRLEETAMASAGRNTPFLGRELTGRVTHTFLEGRLVHHLEEQP